MKKSYLISIIALILFLMSFESKATNIENKNTTPSPKNIIAGIVINQSDEPIVGASIRIGRDYYIERRYFQELDSTIYKTDQDGKFKIPISIPEDTSSEYLNSRYKLLVSAEGYIGTIVRYVNAGNQNLRISLDKGGNGKIKGKVVAKETLTPIGDAEVILKISYLGVLIAKSNMNGEFEIINIPAGDCSIFAIKDSFTQMKPFEFALSENEIKDNILLELDETYTVTGQVLGKDTKLPIANLELRGEAYNEQIISVTDDSSFYTFKNFFPLKRKEKTCLLINVFSDKYIVEKPDYNFECDNAVLLETNHYVTNQVIYIKKGVQISGIILTPDNKPVPDAMISYIKGINAYSKNRDKTDSSGRFTVALEPNTLFQFSVSAKDFAKTTSKSYFIKDQPVDNIVLVLMRGAIIEGKVLSPNNSPMPKTSVWGYKEDPRDSFQDTTDDGGHFKLERIIPGKVILSSRCDEYGKADEILLNVNDNEHIRDVIITFGKKLSISGRVLDEDNRPIVQEYIYAYKDDFAYPERSQTDEDGYYEIKGLNKGTYVLVVESKEYGRVVKKDIQAGGKNVDLIVKKREKVIGKIVDKDTQQPITSFKISYDDKNYEFNNSSGEFELPPPSESRPSLKISSDGYCLIRETFTDDQNKLFIQIEKGRSVKGKILSKNDNQPVEKAKVMIVPFNKGEEATTTTDTNGDFIFTNAISEPHHLIVEAEGFITKDMTFFIKNEKILDLGSIYLGTGCRILGTVYDLNNKPCKDFVLMLNFWDGYTRRKIQTITNANGHYEFIKLQKTSYTIENSQYPEIYKTVVLKEEDEEKQIDFHITNAVINIKILFNNEGVKDAYISAESDDESWRGTTDSLGNISLKGMKGGQYWLSVHYTNVDVIHKEIMIEENKENNFTFIIPDSIIAGKISDHEGNPLFNTTVCLYYNRKDENEKEFHRLNMRCTDNNGNFEFRYQPEGEYIITCYIKENSSVLVKRLLLEFGEQNTDLNLKFGEGGTLELTVRDKETNEPIRNAGVSTFLKYARPLTDKDGKVLFCGFWSDDYKLKIDAKGYREAFEEISLNEDAIIKKEVFLSKE